MSEAECIDQEQPVARFMMVPIGWEEAEHLLGHRVDRRHRFAKRSDGLPEEHTGQFVFELFTHTDSCSGCRETEDGQNVGHYPWDQKAGCFVGTGCHECGYTGKRRTSMWLPYQGALEDI